MLFNTDHHLLKVKTLRFARDSFTEVTMRTKVRYRGNKTCNNFNCGQPKSCAREAEKKVNEISSNRSWYNSSKIRSAQVLSYSRQRVNNSIWQACKKAFLCSNDNDGRILSQGYHFFARASASLLQFQSHNNFSCLAPWEERERERKKGQTNSGEE